MNKNDWFEQGLIILSDFNRSCLTIEKLTNLAGVTKGSFYHHFSNMSEYEIGLVKYWAEQYISTKANIPESPKDCIELLDKIMEDGFINITKPEIAIRAWAQEDLSIRSIVENIDQIRRDFACNIFITVTKNQKSSDMMADFLSALLIGSITMIPRMDSDRVIEMYREFKRVFGLNQE